MVCLRRRYFRTKKPYLPSIIHLFQTFDDPVSQSCAELKVKISGGPLDNQRGIQTAAWLQQKLPKFGFRTHTTALWPVEQSSILFDCPVACQEFPRLAITRSTCINAVSTSGSQGFLVQYPG